MASPSVIGILNITPDSFSDGGKYFNRIDLAINRAYQLVNQGANIVDIGGEATGPGSKPISVEEEISRILPIVQEVSKDITISVDTYKAKTAEAVLKAGASIINDVSGLRSDPDLVKVILKYKAKVIIMHSILRNNLPHAKKEFVSYGPDPLKQIASFLLNRYTYAVSLGIPPQNIILDPGMGLFLSQDEVLSWQLISNLRYIKNFLLANECNAPLLVGVSRKGFLGGALQDRDPLSAFISLECVNNGADFIRIHNVKIFNSFLRAKEKLNMHKKKH